MLLAQVREISQPELVTGRARVTKREGRRESGCNIEAGGLITEQCSPQITISTLFSDSTCG